MNVTVVLPSLNPDEKLNSVVDGLIEKGFTDIVIVNDGSNAEHLKPFEKAAEHPEVTVLTHEVNKGKGRGLKTAFEFVLENRPESKGVVTVDGDGQHTSHDIYNCAKRMVDEKDKVVLGCRDFDSPGVPPKSRFGNKTTSRVFSMFCGMKISDTQTGLRAIPREFLPLLVATKGERFEYETEMFFALHKAHISWVEEKIDTVYIDDNSETHFNPFLDSIKIYRIILKFIFKYTLSSLICCVIDIGLFNLLNVLLAHSTVLDDIKIGTKVGEFFVKVFSGGNDTIALKVLIATVVARIVSSIVNYFLNKNAVFESKTSVKKSMWKYYILCFAQMILAAAGVFALSALFGGGEALEGLVYKPIVDVLLFLGSYQIQQRWVFR
ncbi:MAG: bifunctional glycosyltransferase family 2/GtrA family protein [Lachnospiraceae bacterium]|nr:bifunctional glycosyltransferase family 2/GtrA family protein [Lachnospiraceae bacterium]